MNARETALQVLVACRRSGAWADAALQSSLERQGLAGAEAALCTRLVYGVMQQQMLLDAYLRPLCTQPLERLQPPLLEILRLGAYQIVCLDRVPPSAAVDTAVELAKSAGRAQAAGLVNAVLRRLSGMRDRLPPIEGADTAERLSLAYSHPKWLVERFLSRLTAEETEALLTLNNQVPPITVQGNPLKTTAGDLMSDLALQGVAARPHPFVPDCLEWESAGSVGRLAAFQAGKFFVQDAAARLMTLAAGVTPGQRVLDLCAAPGGKSFSAAFAMEDRGEILACDVHAPKLRRIQEGAVRLGLTCIRTAAMDARQTPETWQNRFDTVLADVPCSGLGVIRKKPDIRYKDPKELAALPALQGQILSAAAGCVRPGGVLVYATCTLLQAENEAVTEGFLSRHPEFALDPVSLPDPVGQTPGAVTLWPQRHGTDGFYICRMRRTGSGAA